MIDIPPDLCCPLCSTIFKNAVQLPCCFVTACRACAYKKLLGSNRSCWVGTSVTCLQSIQLDQLVPAVDLRQKVEEFLNHTKEADKDTEKAAKDDKVQENKNKRRDPRRDPRLKGKLVLCEKIDDEPENEGQENNEGESQGIINSEESQASVGVPFIKQEPIEPIIKQEPLDHLEPFESLPPEEPSQPKYQEYSEISGLIEPTLGHLQSVKTEIKTEQVDDFEENALWNPFGALNVLPETGGSCVCLLCHNPGHELASCPLIKCKNCGQNGHATFNCPTGPTDRRSMSVDSEVPFHLLSPKKEPMDDSGSVGSTSRSAPATASDSSVEQPSSGYFSAGSGRDPACFGKLRWFSEEKTKGVIECFQDGESKTCFVSGYDVKCGAENGDLVEFVLGQDSQYGKAAKKVKLVEKVITEQEKTKRQDSLKRSLEMSSGMADGEGKKMKPDDIIHVKMEVDSEDGWSDIAEDEGGKDGSKTMLSMLTDDQLNVKVEQIEGVEKEEGVQGCICDKGLLVQCTVCPFYYLEASQECALEQDESATIVAKLYSEKKDVKEGLKFIRQLPFPFSCPKGPEFEAIQSLGNESMIKKVSQVFSQDHIFVTVVNNSESEDQIVIKPGDILGICQEHKIDKAQVSPHFMFEPPDRQRCQDLPVFVKKGDLSLDDRNVMCGFGVMGEENMNYKNCLVRVELVPRMARHFTLAKDHLTIQLNRNLWLEIEPKGHKKVDDYIPSNGVIGYAGSVMKDSYIRDRFCVEKAKDNEELVIDKRESGDEDEYESSVLAVKEEDIKDEVKTEVDEAAYDDMLAQIDMDMMTNKVEAEIDIPVFDPKYAIQNQFKAIVKEDVLRIPPNGRVISILRIQEERNAKIVPNIVAKALVKNNEEFKYYNNCYNIEEQVVPIYFEKCKFSRKSLPCVKICIQNPRNEEAFLPRLSPIALVNLKTDSGAKSEPKKLPVVTIPEPPIPVKSPVPPPPRRKKFSPLKTMHATQKKSIRKWNTFLQQNTFQKSLLVEQKYPYFRSDRKPKVPYGLKDLSELNMRVGLDQNCKPAMVLKKVNGVFTCTICDQIILDKFTLQDHWYGKKHKQNMRLVQVIAGLPERLHMNRPVVKELLDQFTACPLLGLDHVIEVLRGEVEPVYYCSLCFRDNSLIGMSHLIEHLTSCDHIIKFLKEYFPAAWEKFSQRPDPANWTEKDVANFNAIVVKIEAVHGRKNPSIVENNKKLEEAIDKIPIDTYQTKRAELEMFFKSIQTTEEAPEIEEILEEGSIQSRIAILAETIQIPPNTARIGVLKILNGSGAGHIMAGRMVKVSKNPSKIGECNVKPGASRVWLESSIAFIQVTLFNPMVSNSITVKKNSDLVTVKWRN